MLVTDSLHESDGHVQKCHSLFNTRCLREKMFSKHADDVGWKMGQDFVRTRADTQQQPADHAGSQQYDLAPLFYESSKLKDH